MFFNQVVQGLSSNWSLENKSCWEQDTYFVCAQDFRRRFVVAFGEIIMYQYYSYKKQHKL